MKKIASISLVGLFLGSLLMGCGSSPPPPTPEEMTQYETPPEYAAEMQAQQEAEEKAAGN